MHIIITCIAGLDNVIADSISQFHMQRFRLLAPDANPLLDPIRAFPTPILSQHCDQCQSLGVATSICRVYQCGLNSFYKFCEKYRIQPLPASSLTLQFFCVDVSSQVSYKTLKVYLTAIRLEHLEQGFSDPTNDEILYLVCRGI